MKLFRIAIWALTLVPNISWAQTSNGIDQTLGVAFDPKQNLADRMTAKESLLRADPSKLLPRMGQIREATKSEDYFSRYAAFSCLQKFPEEVAEDATILVRWLLDDATPVRFLASDFLRENWKNLKASQRRSVLNLVTKPDWTIREKVSWQIASVVGLTQPEVEILFHQFGVEPAESTRRNIAVALSHSDASKNLAQMYKQKILTEKRIGVFLAKASLVGTLDFETATSIANTSSSREFIIALLALPGPEISKKRASEIMDQGLIHKDPEVRAQAMVVQVKMAASDKRKELVPQLLESLKDDNKEIRNASFEALDLLGELEKIPEASATEALSDADPRLRFQALRYFTFLNKTQGKKLPHSLVIKARTKLLGEPNKKPLCEVLCGLAQRSSSWLDAKFREDPDLVANRDKYNLAIANLQLLFVLRASRECPEIKDASKKILEMTLRPSTDLACSSMDVADPFAKLALLSNQLSGKLEVQETEMEFETMDIYRDQFGILVLSELEAVFPSEKERLNIRRSRITEKVRANVGQAKERAPGGSAFNSYAFAASLLALGEGSRDLVSPLRVVANSLKDKMRFPYSLSSGWSETTRRFSAGRNVMAYLAITAAGLPTDRERTGDLEILRAAIANWVEYQEDFSLHALVDRTHIDSPDPSKSDKMAAHLFYPTIPYIVDAIRFLDGQPNLTTEDKMTLNGYLQKIEELVRWHLGQDNSVVPMGGPDRENQGIWFNAPAYSTPLIGLTVLGLAGHCHGNASEPSRAILRSELFR